MALKIDSFAAPDNQMAKLGKLKWRCSRLFQLAKDLPVMEIPLEHMHIYQRYDSLTLRDLVVHFRAMRDADMEYPIILDEDGEILDGRHRLMKALIEERDTIKAVRFTENPAPCEVEEE